LYRDFEAGAISEAIALLEQVLEREPNNAWASSLAGFCHASAFSNMWTQDIWASRENALKYYDHAMHLGGENAQVLCYCAAIQVSIAGDMEIAGRLIDHALELIPDSTNTLFWGGFLDIVIGMPERGLERLEGSLRVNPRSTVRPYLIAGMGICLMELERYAEGAVVLTEALQQVPNYHAALGALSVCLAHLGKFEEAAAMRNRLMALGGMPGILAILQDANHREIVSSGMTLAETGAS
jgi:tetratricopeptide (TPR) repeat protein